MVVALGKFRNSDKYAFLFVFSWLSFEFAHLGPCGNVEDLSIGG